MKSLLLVILKDDTEELKLHLKDKVMSLMFDENWKETGMIAFDILNGHFKRQSSMFYFDG